MKKKTLIIIIAAVVLLAAVITGIICMVNYNSYKRYFTDTNYPAALRWKDGSIRINVKDQTKSDIVWNAVPSDADYVSVVAKGKPGTKKAGYVITPTAPGMTDISITKSVTIGDVSYDSVKILLHAYISESPEGLEISFAEEPELIFGDKVIGAGTDHPVILRDNSSDDYYEEGMIYGNVYFLNGRGDWIISADNGDIEIQDRDEADGSFSYLFYSVEGSAPPILEESQTDDPGMASASGGEASEAAAPDADKREAVLTLSSQSLNITETYNVSFFTDGHMEFNRVDK